MVTSHIRRMLRASELLAAWCEVGDKVHTSGAWEEGLIEKARRIGPEATAQFAATLARHAAAELDMEYAQSLYDWPEV